MELQRQGETDPNKQESPPSAGSKSQEMNIDDPSEEEVLERRLEQEIAEYDDHLKRYTESQSRSLELKKEYVESIKCDARRRYKRNLASLKSSQGTHKEGRKKTKAFYKTCLKKKVD